MGILKNIFGGKEEVQPSEEQIYFEKKLEAVNQSQAVIEFDSSGNIVDANENFLNLFGYSLNEIVGQHHSIFVTPEYRSSNEYKQFWQDLSRGISINSEFQRISKEGNSIWILGSYNPLKDESGRVTRVVKFATDITETKIQNADYQGQIEAISKSQAVIEFNMDGTVITANQNFLDALGYCLSDIQGKHHSMFVEANYVSTADYKKFWDHLNSGQFLSGEYKRIGNNNKEVWIQASYNPIFDMNGKPFKVVKYAIDVTAEKLKNADYEGQISAVNKSQAVIEFGMDGIILTANNNFLKTMGYNLEDIQGKHHSMFAEPDYAASVEYKQFWERLNQGVFDTGEYLRLGKNGKNIWIQASYNPIMDLNGRPMKVVKYATDITAQKEQEVENKRLADQSNVLKIIQTCVILTDNDFNIVYINDQFRKLFRSREAEMRSVFANFQVDKLVGSSIDMFHKNPAHQHSLLRNLTEPYDTEITLAGLHFALTAAPWINLEGERIGTILQWVDKTAEVGIENEIDAMVQAASAGDFSKQVALDSKTGFFLTLGRGLNDLVSTVEVALNDILRMLGAMARGDLSERITREYSGTFGQLKSDANTTADKLTEIITKIRNSSSAISSAANEIAQGNADLSQRTEEQASSLEETASSMEEMTSTVKASSDNAQQANKLAQDAQDKAQQGGQVVSNAVTAMQEINESSKKISDIIGVIDEIAFQTNLLALNAAVEAARAGEQGRGFAVVAGEVRNLAQRSAAAAKEIKDLIRDSVDKVEDGARLVNESGQTLSDIVSAVEEVTTMIREIAEAAREQTSGIEQVNTAVSQMDEMTQQNAALVEEASAAGEAMADQARNMNQVVEFFSIRGGAALEQSQPGQSRTSSSTPAVAKKSVPSSSDDEEWEDF